LIPPGSIPLFYTLAAMSKNAQQEKNKMDDIKRNFIFEFISMSYLYIFVYQFIYKINRVFIFIKVRIFSPIGYVFFSEPTLNRFQKGQLPIAYILLN